MTLFQIDYKNGLKMLAKELKSHRKKNMHAFLRSLKEKMNTPKKQEHTHKIKVRGDVALKEMDSFFDWRLRSSEKKRNRSLFEEAPSDYETTDNDTQSAHEPHDTTGENIDGEPNENIEEQSARFESDEGEEEV